MIVLYYNREKHTVEELQNTYNFIKTNINDEVIMLPKDVDVLFDCSIDQLITIKTIIEKVINTKEQLNEM